MGLYLSEKGSFELWNLITYIKGRKKGVITAIGATIASWIGISDIELVNILLGLGFEMLISVIEFYAKDVEVKE